MARRPRAARRPADARRRRRARADARRQEPAADRRHRRRPASSTAASSSAASRPTAARSRAGSSTTARRKRRASCAGRRREIEAVLGYVDEPELIHRDNLVVLAERRTRPRCGVRLDASVATRTARRQPTLQLAQPGSARRRYASTSGEQRMNLVDRIKDILRRAAQRMGEDRRRAGHRAVALHRLDHDPRGDRPDRAAAVDAFDPARDRAVRALADHHVRAGADRRRAGAVVRRHEGFHRVAEADRVQLHGALARRHLHPARHARRPARR